MIGWLKARLGGAGAAGTKAAPRVPEVPEIPEAPRVDWRERGNAALAEGALGEAARCYAQGIAEAPGDPVLRLNHGFVLLEQAHYQAAAERLEQALALCRPDDDFAADANFLLGRAQLAQGRGVQALASFEAAVAANPAFAPAIEELARRNASEGRWEAALSWAQRLRAIGDSVQGALLEGRAQHALGRHDRALAALDAALALDADDVEALEGRGNVLMELRRPQEALRAFEQVLAVRGPDAGAWSNGVAPLCALGRFDEALAWAGQALELDPRHRHALYNRSQVLLEALRPGDALAAAQHGARLYPQDADFEWNAALAHLTLGDLAQGWTAYESRWRAPVLGAREPAPGRGHRWNGEPLAGRSLLVFSEQGLGDSIQFMRFLPQVAQLARKVYLRVQAPLLPLLADLPGNCELLAPGQALPEVDFECPLLSLPLGLGTTWETLPRTVPYLRAPSSRVREWEARLGPGVGQLRVGLAWSGNPRHRLDHKRSLPLELLRKAWAGAPCQFVSLQKELRPEDDAALRNWPGLRHFGDALQDFGDTAALVDALDLVISVDTSVAHLAGALGRPLWIPLDHGGEWRWLVDREDSPWYPSARLYRQARPGEWPEVLARIARDLEGFRLESASAYARVPVI